MQMDELLLCGKFGDKPEKLGWLAPSLGCLWWQTYLEESLPGKLRHVVALTISKAPELKKLDLQVRCSNITKEWEFSCCSAA